MLLLNQDPRRAISQLFLVLGEGCLIRLPLHDILSLTTVPASRVLFFLQCFNEFRPKKREPAFDSGSSELTSWRAHDLPTDRQFWTSAPL